MMDGFVRPNLIQKNAALTCVRMPRVDSDADFCQAAHMFSLSRQFIAVLLTLWLPLFSGNALAVSITMQAKGGDCHTAMKANVAHSDTSMHQHMQHAGHLAQQPQHDHQSDQQPSSHKDCGVCQLACCGYMATVTTDVANLQLPAQSFNPSTTQFQSATLSPLVPPPLALA
jgi:hypothetical protein